MGIVVLAYLVHSPSSMDLQLKSSWSADAAGFWSPLLNVHSHLEAGWTPQPRAHARLQVKSGHVVMWCADVCSTAL